jgi:hypothetical protein
MLVAGALGPNTEENRSDQVKEFVKLHPYIVQTRAFSDAARLQEIFDHTKYIQGTSFGLIEAGDENFSLPFIQNKLLKITNVVKPIADVVDKIQSFDTHDNHQSSHMFTPRPVLNFEKMNSYDSSVFSLFHQLNLPVSFLRKSSLSETERMIIWHEYGHLLFFSNLFNKKLLKRESENDPKIEDFYRECPDIKNTYEEFVKSSESSYLLSSICSKESRWFFPRSKLEELLKLNLEAEILKVSNSFAPLSWIKRDAYNFSPIVELSLKYEEIYADFVVAVMSANPNFSYVLFPKDNLSFLLRSFSFNYKELDNYPLVKAKVLRKKEGVPHFELYYLRNELWEFFYSKETGRHPGQNYLYDGYVLRQSFRILAQVLYSELDALNAQNFPQ